MTVPSGPCANLLNSWATLFEFFPTTVHSAGWRASSSRKESRPRWWHWLTFFIKGCRQFYFDGKRYFSACSNESKSVSPQQIHTNSIIYSWRKYYLFWLEQMNCYHCYFCMLEIPPFFANKIVYDWHCRIQSKLVHMPYFPTHLRLQFLVLLLGL